jgi:hypothetical protein
MTLSQGRVWAFYVAGALILSGGVAAGVVTSRSGETATPDPGPPPPPSITVSAPGIPSAVYPHQSRVTASPGPSCSSVTAVDAENVSRQFVLAVGEAYAATSQSRRCQPATVVAYSEVKERDYTMDCAPAAEMVRCTGGRSAVIIFRPGT